jgi:hypothetical protein
MILAMIRQRITSKHILLLYSLSIITLYLTSVIDKVNPVILTPVLIYILAKAISKSTSKSSIRNPFPPFKYSWKHFIGGGISGLTAFAVYFFSTSTSIPLVYTRTVVDAYRYYLRIADPQNENISQIFLPVYTRYFYWAKIIHSFNFSTPAFRIALLSGIFASLCVFFTYLMILRLTSAYPIYKRMPFFQMLIPGLVCLSFAFSQLFWSQSTLPEVYTHSLMNVSIVLFLLVNWPSKHQKLYFFVFNTLLFLLIDAHLSNLAYIPLILFYIYYHYHAIVKSKAYWSSIIIGFSILMVILEVNKISQLGLRRLSGGEEDIFSYYSGFYENLIPFFFQRTEALLHLIEQQIGLLGMILIVVVLLLNLIKWRNLFINLLFLMIISQVVFFLLFYAAFDVLVFYLPSIYLLFLLLFYAITQILQSHKSLLKAFLTSAKCDSFLKLLKYGFLVILVCIPVIWQLVKNWEKTNKQVLESQEITFNLLNSLVAQNDILVCHESLSLFCANYLVYDSHSRPETEYTFSKIADGSKVSSSSIQSLLSENNSSIYVLLSKPNINDYIYPEEHPSLWGDLIFIFDWSYPDTEIPHIFLYEIKEFSPEQVLLEDPTPDQAPVFPTSFLYQLDSFSVIEQPEFSYNLYSVNLFWEIDGVDNRSICPYQAPLKISAFREVIYYEIAEGNYQRLIAEYIERDRVWILDTFQVVLPGENAELEIISLEEEFNDMVPCLFPFR